VTTFNLRRARLRSGEQLRETVELELEPFTLGGQEYVPEPARVPAELTITRATTGTVFELAFRASLRGPCFRCLRDSVVSEPVRAREYQAANPGAGSAGGKAADARRTGGTADEELRNPYLRDDQLDLSAWARDAFALQLPDKILHAPDCKGLCPVCGKDLNEEPHTHDEPTPDPRWSALEQLRERS
jgi:uncharacterized protein